MEEIRQILAGLDDAKVTVYDVFPVNVEAKVRNNMKLLVEKGIVTEADVDNIVSKISFTQDMNDEGVKNAQCIRGDGDETESVRSVRGVCSR